LTGQSSSTSFLKHYNIGYPNAKNCVCSVAEGFGSYGYEDDTLEILGLISEEEKWEDVNVLGYLTAEDVFSRISQHYNQTK